MSDREAIWALFLLLPRKTKLLYFPNDAMPHLQAATDIWRRGETLVKGVSELDFKALMYTTKILGSRDGKEFIFPTKLQKLLDSFEMKVSVESVRKDNDRIHLFTVESSKADGKKWDYYGKVRAAIYQSKKVYNNKPAIITP